MPYRRIPVQRTTEVGPGLISERERKRAVSGHEQVRDGEIIAAGPTHPHDRPDISDLDLTDREEQADDLRCLIRCAGLVLPVRDHGDLKDPLRVVTAAGEEPSPGETEPSVHPAGFARGVRGSRHNSIRIAPEDLFGSGIGQARGHRNEAAGDGDVPPGGAVDPREGLDHANGCGGGGGVQRAFVGSAVCHVLVPGPGREGIVIAVPSEEITAAAAMELIVTVVAEQPISPGSAQQDVVAVTAHQFVVAVGAPHPIVAAFAQEDVVALTAHIVSLPAPALTMSLPAPASVTSSSSVPMIVSPAEVPDIVTRSPPQIPTRGAALAGPTTEATSAPATAINRILRWRIQRLLALDEENRPTRRKASTGLSHTGSDRNQMLLDTRLDQALAVVL